MAARKSPFLKPSNRTCLKVAELQEIAKAPAFMESIELEA